MDERAAGARLAQTRALTAEYDVPYAGPHRVLADPTPQILADLALSVLAGLALPVLAALTLPRPSPTAGTVS
ncbi:hypothetical protein [Streptomyces sp.]|uniref:hypothetical protein n=1 Tax=Streptomyces sp. TaxID=1931 RepID=UPI002F40A7A4